MAGGITQKEKTIIQDQMRHEEVCIRKYRDYAKEEVSKPLKTMFNEIAQQEQQHYNTLNSLLSGSSGQQSPGQSQESLPTQKGKPAQMQQSQTQQGQGQAQQTQGQMQQGLSGFGQPTKSQGWPPSEGQIGQSQYGGGGAGGASAGGFSGVGGISAGSSASVSGGLGGSTFGYGGQSWGLDSNSGGGQSASSETSDGQSGASGSSQSQSADSGMQGAPKTHGEAPILRDLLMTEQFVSASYDKGVFDSVTPEVRQTLQHIQKDEQEHGRRIKDYMDKKGMTPKQ